MFLVRTHRAGWMIFLFLNCSSPSFFFVDWVFHFTFCISYQILPCLLLLYYDLWWGSDRLLWLFSFLHTLHCSFHTHPFLLLSTVCDISFLLCPCTRPKHLCKCSTFTTAVLNGTCLFTMPVAEVLAYLHVQISPISCNVVGSILHMLGKNTDRAIVGYQWMGVGGTPRPVLLTGANKSGVLD